MSTHDAERAQRSRRSFMHWPTEWLWAAVIVSVALLVMVGLALR